MSGRPAIAVSRTNGVAARVALAALLALACGVVAADEPARVPTDPNAKKLDTKAPLPADTPGRNAHDKFAVKNSDRVIFSKIEDFKPVASQEQNREEYDAWCEIVSHARQFSAADLEAHAARDLSVLELRKPIRTTFRTELIRFDGRVVCARRLDAPKHFKDNPEFGVKELYEVRLIPTDESPLDPVSVVFTELPAELAAVTARPMRTNDRGESLGVGEWLTLDDRGGRSAGPKLWASAAGFYFKTMSVPGDEANSVVAVPVLIGKSVTPLAGPPAPPGPDATALDPGPRVYKHIKDKTALFHDLTDQWELVAYTRVLIHANRFAPEQIEEHALKDVKFADLFLDTRTSYRLKAVRFEGRLIALKKKEANAEMKAAGVDQVYEGWLVPANEPRGNPIRADFVTPPDGVEPGGRVNKWVSFAGYSFKLIKYESAEDDPDQPGKKLFKFAPLLIGKGAIARPDLDPDRPTSVTWSAFVLWAIAGGVLLIASGGVLAWYYRGGDRKARAAIDGVRGKNPFDAPGGATATNATADPPVRPSNEW